MEAVILAGGFGKRLRPMVSEVPKPMAPINGRPFLTILLDSLSVRGFDRVVLSVGYMWESIYSCIGKTYANMEIVYSKEDSPMGTGGGLKLALLQCKADVVHVLNGDTYIDEDSKLLQELSGHTSLPLIVGKWVQDTSRYGRLYLRGDRIVMLSEKGATGPGYINSGYSVMGVNSLLNFSHDKPFSLEGDYFSPLAADQGISIFRSQGTFIDIGTPEDYIIAGDVLKVCLGTGTKSK